MTKFKLAPGETEWDEGLPPTRDHIIPLAVGGIDKAKNIVKACGSCNRSKGSHLPEEFLKLLMAGQWKISAERRATMIENIRVLIERIEPYRSELFKKEVAAATAVEDWPDPEQAETFDWSLSMRDIERRYTPMVVRPKMERLGRYTESANMDKDINPKVLALYEQSKKTGKEDFPSFMKRLGRYRHVHQLLTAANPDLPRWIFDNLINKQL